MAPKTVADHSRSSDARGWQELADRDRGGGRQDGRTAKHGGGNALHAALQRQSVSSIRQRRRSTRRAANSESSSSRRRGEAADRVARTVAGRDAAAGVEAWWPAAELRDDGRPALQRSAANARGDRRTARSGPLAASQGDPAKAGEEADQERARRWRAARTGFITRARGETRQRGAGSSGIGGGRRRPTRGGGSGGRRWRDDGRRSGWRSWRGNGGLARQQGNGAVNNAMVLSD
ncbi:hypothetical protein Scep_004175 [Stephania cephalantha]|uniref:Uncharacterized protein n=1 Tax=Stephania cephalantha TaxID=152367 RepID=A0AAP0PYT5_9MAGN